MANGHFYVINAAATSESAIITLIQLKTGATTPAEIIRTGIAETLSVTSTKQRMQINRKSGAATVTSFTPLLYFGSDPVAAAAGGTSATGTLASAEGTDTDILVQDAFNFLSPHIFLPVPEERIMVAAAAFLGLKLPVTVNTGTYEAMMLFKEVI